MFQALLGEEMPSYVAILGRAEVMRRSGGDSRMATSAKERRRQGKKS